MSILLSIHQICPVSTSPSCSQWSININSLYHKQLEEVIINNRACPYFLLNAIQSYLDQVYYELYKVHPPMYINGSEQNSKDITLMWMWLRKVCWPCNFTQQQNLYKHVTCNNILQLVSSRCMNSYILRLHVMNKFASQRKQWTFNIKTYCKGATTIGINSCSSTSLRKRL